MTEIGNAFALCATLGPILPLSRVIAWLAGLLGRRP